MRVVHSLGASFASIALLSPALRENRDVSGRSLFCFATDRQVFYRAPDVFRATPYCCVYAYGTRQGGRARQRHLLGPPGSGGRHAAARAHRQARPSARTGYAGAGRLGRGLLTPRLPHRDRSGSRPSSRRTWANVAGDADRVIRHTAAPGHAVRARPGRRATVPVNRVQLPQAPTFAPGHREVRREAGRHRVPPGSVVLRRSASMSSNCASPLRPSRRPARRTASIWARPTRPHDRTVRPVRSKRRGGGTLRSGVSM